MCHVAFIRKAAMIAAWLMLMTLAVQAEELTLSISTIDTFRVDEKAAGLRGALVIPAIPQGDSIYIDFAELIIPISTTPDSTDPLILFAGPILKQWTPGQDSLQVSLAGAGEGFDAHLGGLYPMGHDGSAREIRIDVTSIVTKWQQAELSNYGLLIKSITEDKSSFSIIKDGRYNGGHAKLRIMYCRP